MAKSAASSNPVTAAVAKAVKTGKMARSDCDFLISAYADIYDADLDTMLAAIRNGSITILEYR